MAVRIHVHQIYVYNAIVFQYKAGYCVTIFFLPYAVITFVLRGCFWIKKEKKDRPKDVIIYVYICLSVDKEKYDYSVRGEG